MHPQRVPGVASVVLHGDRDGQVQAKGYSDQFGQRWRVSGPGGQQQPAAGAATGGERDLFGERVVAGMVQGDDAVAEVLAELVTAVEFGEVVRVLVEPPGQPGEPIPSGQLDDGFAT